MTDLGEAIRDMVREVVRDEVRRALGEIRASDGPRHVSVATYAREREVGQSTVRRAIAEGRLAHVRVGRSVRIRSDAIITPPRGDSPQARAERVWKRLTGATTGRDP